MTQEALKLALEALEEAWYHIGTFQPTEKAIDLYDEARTAIKEALAQPEFTKHEVESADDWSEWVCPDAKGYLMKCCDCGLVHEAEFGVVRYKSETEREACDFVDDPNLQAVFRMRRSEQWSPEDTAHRAGGLPMAQPEQEPVATLFGSLPVYDTTTPQRIEPEPVQQVGTIGHIGDGSTTLTRAIAPLLSKAQAQAQPEQEPVALPCCGYADSSAIKWNPYSQVVQCHNCGQVYTLPPQRTWVGLTDEERNEIANKTFGREGALTLYTEAIEAKLKQKNGYAEEKNT